MRVLLFPIPERWTQNWVRWRGRLRLDAASVDGLDAGLRALAVGIVLGLSLFGYQYTPPVALLTAISPTVVAAGLVVYNAAVVLVLGVPWRRRPGFILFALDWLVITGAIVLTGGFFSPFLVLYYAMVIGAALRLGLGRSLLLVTACSLVYAVLSSSDRTPADTGAIHLPWLVVGVTSLLMVAVTALALRRAADIEQTRARLEEQTAERLRLLNDLSLAVLSASPDTDALLRTVAAIAPDVLRADYGVAVLLDRQGQPQRVAHSDGSAPLLPPGALALAQAASQQDAPLILALAPDDPRRLDLAALLGPVETVACCPLRLEGQLVGALFVASERPRLFSPADRSLLQAIGQQLALPVRLARLYDLERDKAAEADARERLERDLLNTVSHELRTPLTAIKTSISGILAGPEARPLAEARLLQNIDRSTERLILLVNDVLDMARLRAGRVTLQRTPLDVAEVLRETGMTVRPLADAKGQRLDLVLAVPPPDLVVMADRRRLEQVLLNILHNAIKYTPAGGQIRVGATAGAAGVRVWVADSGPGIAPADQARIFERFYIARTANGERSDATGLGLPIARLLVELHGGELGVASQVGAGSTFYFTLPREPHSVSGATGNGVYDTVSESQH